jgi:hypothetical protein
MIQEVMYMDFLSITQALHQLFYSHSFNDIYYHNFHFLEYFYKLFVEILSPFYGLKQIDPGKLEQFIQKLKKYHMWFKTIKEEK